MKYLDSVPMDPNFPFTHINYYCWGLPPLITMAYGMALCEVPESSWLVPTWDTFERASK